MIEPLMADSVPFGYFESSQEDVLYVYIPRELSYLSWRFLSVDANRRLQELEEASLLEALAAYKPPERTQPPSLVSLLDDDT